MFVPVFALYTFKMKRLSRKTYNEVISATDERKAIALLIFIKNRYKSSVVLNFSYYKLSKLTGLHKSTVKKRLNILGDMELLEFIGKGNKHLLFKKVRAARSNVRLDGLDLSNLKAIETGLQALFIMEEQNRKMYVNHQVIKGTSPKGHLSKSKYREWKKAKKFCTLNGLTEFSDNGISFETLSKRMKTSKSKVASAIELGEKLRLFKRNHNFKVIHSFDSKKDASLCFKHNFQGRLRVIDNNVVYVMCNTYSMLVNHGRKNRL